MLQKGKRSGSVHATAALHTLIDPIDPISSSQPPILVLNIEAEEEKNEERDTHKTRLR